MMKLSVIDKNNPIVFLDLAIDKERAGRVVIELRKDVVPKTAENFRALCTGEKGIGIFGKPLHFIGSKFHRAVTLFMVQGGDIISSNGCSGESIYGKTFEDENFVLTHEVGAVSMANEGLPHTNSSQFFVATVPCSHLDGRNVVFGQVLRGLGIVTEIDKCERNEKDMPLVDCYIMDCGEIKPGEDWGTGDTDCTVDTLSAYPEDWEDATLSFEDIIKKISVIKKSGNKYFYNGYFKTSCRKYEKSIRYLEWLMDKVTLEHKHLAKDQPVASIIDRMKADCYLNLAAAKLKLLNYKEVVYLCNQVLQNEPKNVKAIFRRGQANMLLNNYEVGMVDLYSAKMMCPYDKFIREELHRAEKINIIYKNFEKGMYRKMFI